MKQEINYRYAINQAKRENKQHMTDIRVLYIFRSCIEREPLQKNFYVKHYSDKYYERLSWLLFPAEYPCYHAALRQIDFEIFVINKKLEDDENYIQRLIELDRIQHEEYVKRELAREHFKQDPIKINFKEGTQQLLFTQ